MTLAIQILACWLATSILIAVIWSFHFSNARAAARAFNHWIETHPGVPLDEMPEEIALNYFLV